jgi:hypothetical protein
MQQFVTYGRPIAIGRMELLAVVKDLNMGSFNQKTGLYPITSVDLGIPSLQPKDRVQDLPSAY